MMLNQFSRTQLLFGKEAMERLAKCRVAVFGIGGVGGYAVEALARSGIGALDLVDHDKVSLTNLNRQLHATRKAVGSVLFPAPMALMTGVPVSCAFCTRASFPVTVSMASTT